MLDDELISKLWTVREKQTKPPKSLEQQVNSSFWKPALKNILLSEVFSSDLHKFDSESSSVGFLLSKECAWGRVVCTDL